MMRISLAWILVVITVGCGLDIDDILKNTPPQPPKTSTQPRPPSVECYATFPAFKRAQGKAGPGKHWHHLVNKNPKNEAKFGGLKLHCTNNVIPLDATIHQNISNWYNSKRDESGGLLVRDWQAQFDWDTQRAYGIKKLHDFGGKLPESWTR